MLQTAGLTLCALLAGVGFALTGWMSLTAALHVVFAVGILPLIFAAMIHFVPVLTRTRDPAPLIARIPFVAQLAGIPVGLAMAGIWPYFLLHLSASLDLICAVVLLIWMLQRARATLGAPHPGWRWYFAALFCLVIALLAILMMNLVPQFWFGLRRIHLHLNLLGFVGLAALGTLPVLLPTAVNQADPEAARWLHCSLLLVVVGVLGIAFGSIFSPMSGALCGLLLIGVVLSLALRWHRLFGAALWRDGAVFSLSAAAFGLVLMLTAGGLHGLGEWRSTGQQLLIAWFCAFLLPLVSGALSQLLPVWRMPGRVTPARGAMRALLVSGGKIRASCFVMGGIAVLLGKTNLATALVLAGLGLFVLAFVRAMGVPRSTR